MTIVKHATIAFLSAGLFLALCITCSAAEGDAAPATEPSTQPAFSRITLDGGTLRVTGNVNMTEKDLGTLTLNINAEKVKATYLGVETTSAGETLGAQLKLPRGVGLAVKHVEGPAASAGVREHDVLYKLNDQLLITTEQLAVLVRTFKPGDKVELTVIREAQPVQLSATLVEKEVESISLTDFTTTSDWRGFTPTSETRYLGEEVPKETPRR